MKNATTDCLNVVVEALETSHSPIGYDSVHDYIDAVTDVARTTWGPLNAAQRSAIEKWARDDYNDCMSVE